MKLSTQDKMALMMTSAESQRSLASLIGVSHQRVGRWLTIGQTLPSGEPSKVREPKDPAIRYAIESAFQIHVQLARDQARAHKIPFDQSAPAFAYRLPLTDGTPGGRVIIPHTHRIRDDLRNRIITNAAKSNRYYGVAVRSTVNLKVYFQQAEKRFAGRGVEYVRDKTSWIRRDFMKREINAHEKAYRAGIIDEQDTNIRRGMFTPITAIGGFIPPEESLQQLNRALRERHQPATSGEKTAFADEILLQVATQRDPMADDIANAQHEHRLLRKAKQAKARRAKQRAKRKG
ncbi:MAG: hypothetical protein ACOYBQ_10205 [Fluviibacter sp.]